jgi:nitrite reductase (NO-forming)
MDPRRTVAALAVAAVLAGGCAHRAEGPGPQPTTHPSAGPRGARQAPTITVVLADFTIDPRVLRARAGRVTFEITNRGAIDHDFQIPDLEAHHGHEQHLFKPGETRKLEYDLTPGTHQVVCTIPGHREAGMTATLAVSP